MTYLLHNVIKLRAVKCHISQLLYLCVQGVFKGVVMKRLVVDAQWEEGYDETESGKKDGGKI